MSANPKHQYHRTNFEVRNTENVLGVIKVLGHTVMSRVTVAVWAGIIAIITVFILKICFGFTLLSDTVLGITALIVLWYTYETYLIRRTSQEILFKSQRPAVQYAFFVNQQNCWDTRFRISNLSDYPVAARVKCTFKIANTPFENTLIDYNGTRYWNLQYKSSEEGHFDLLYLYHKANYFDKNKYDSLLSCSLEAINNEFEEIVLFKYNGRSPRLTLEVEVYCTNSFGQSVFYPTVIYTHDPSRKVWIPTITSEKPYWEFSKKPNWIRET